MLVSRASIGARLSRAVEVPGSFAVGAKPPRCLRLAKRRRQRGPAWGLLQLRLRWAAPLPGRRPHQPEVASKCPARSQSHGACQPPRRRRAPLRALPQWEDLCGMTLSSQSARTCGEPDRISFPSAGGSAANKDPNFGQPHGCVFKIGRASTPQTKTKSWLLLKWRAQTQQDP